MELVILKYYQSAAQTRTMLTPDQVQTIQDTVATAKTVLVIFSPQASVDQVASAVALHQGLLALGKSSSLVSPLKPARGFSLIEGIDQTTQQLGNKNLEISFDYQEDMVDKVSYNIDDVAKKFRLVISPRQDAKPLDDQTVTFAYTGAEADLIFLIGVPSLDSLDAVYFQYEALFQDTTTVSINTFETTFGSVKINTAGAASTSEVIAYLLQQFGAEFTSEIATNLITGIEAATDKLQSLATTADTFEILSTLLRAGGRRVARSKNLTGSGFNQVVAGSQNENVLQAGQSTQMIEAKPVNRDNRQISASADSFAKAISKAAKSSKR